MAQHTETTDSPVAGHGAVDHGTAAEGVTPAAGDAAQPGAAGALDHSAAATPEGGVDAAHGGVEAVGMPQLDFSTFPNQIFWLAIALVAIYLLLQRTALPRIAAVLAERNGAIANDIARAEELKKAAQDAEAAYDKALAEARSEGQRIAQETRAGIQADLDEAIAHADAEIAAKGAESEAAIAEIRDGAMANVEEVARETAAEIVRAFGAEPDQGAVDAAIDQRMKG